jgi:hypothetical protein
MVRNRHAPSTRQLLVRAARLACEVNDNSIRQCSFDAVYDHGRHSIDHDAGASVVPVSQPFFRTRS